MIRMLVIFILLLNLKTYAATNLSDCEVALHQVHAEIAKINSGLRNEGRDLARLSSRGSVESRFLHVNAPSTGHAVSFGSGPDIFRLIQDFPLVPHLHLVDMLFGQSDPGRIIREIERRLNALGNVELVRPGFVTEFTWEILDNHTAAYERVIRMFPTLHDNPRIWRLRWTKPGSRSMETLIYLHMLDFDHISHMAPLLSQMESSGGLNGALMTGASLQNPAVIQMVLDQLQVGAHFAYEVFYKLDGSLQQLGPDDHSYQEFLALISARSDIRLNVLRPQPNEAGKFGNFSRMHLLTKTSHSLR
ncbi:MAG: hypothetical protein AB7N80_07525 [Bdellovibrionales bacterium]